MECNSPVFIQQPYKNPLKHALNFKKYPKGLWVRCGRCLACRKNRAKSWSIRLEHENLFWEKSVFITLTYEDGFLPDKKSLDKTELQKFFKRLRQAFVRNKDKRKLRYFAAGEYGGRFLRPHYHIILFGYDFDEIKVDNFYNVTEGPLKDSWIYGNINVGFITAKSISYVTGYCTDKLSDRMISQFDGMQEPFQLVSNGMGLRMAEKYQDKYREDLGISMQGVNYALPRYYKKKLKILPEAYKQILQNHQDDAIIHHMTLGKTRNEVDKALEESRMQAEREMRAKLSLKTQISE